MILRKFVVGPLEANCYILYDPSKKEGFIIDPGADAEKLLTFVKKEKISLKFIINTHGHPDHTGANKELKEFSNAPILIHEYDAGLLTLVHELIPFCIPGACLSPPADILLKDGDLIKCAGAEFKVLHTPGHTPGGISLMGENVIFTGDTLFAGSVGRTDLPGGSWEQLLNSVRRILRSGENVKIYPGHGDATTVAYELHHNPFIT